MIRSGNYARNQRQLRRYRASPLGTVPTVSFSQDFAVSGSFVIPAGCTSLNVANTGRGGSGAVGDGDFPGGGGQGGGFSSKTIAVTAGNTHTITIGAGGSIFTDSDGSTAVVKALNGADAVPASGVPGDGGTSDQLTGALGTVKYHGGDGAAGSGDNGGGGGEAAGPEGHGAAASGSTGGSGTTSGGDGGTGAVGNPATGGAAPGGGGGGDDAGNDGRAAGGAANVTVSGIKNA